MSAACGGCGARLWQEMKFCAECGIKVPPTAHVDHSTSPRAAISPKQISFALIPIVYEEPKTAPESPTVPPRRQHSTPHGAPAKGAVLRKSNSQPSMSSWISSAPSQNTGSATLRNSSNISSPRTVNYTLRQSPPIYTSAPTSPRSDVVTEDPPSPPPRSLTRSLPNKPSNWVNYTPQSRSHQSLSPPNTSQFLQSYNLMLSPRTTPYESNTNNEIPSSTYNPGIPPPLPMSQKPRLSTAPASNVLESPRSVLTTSGTSLIPINTANIIAKQGGAHTIPTSENEVILVTSTYNAQSPPPSLRKSVVMNAVPIRKAASPEMLKISSTVDPKRWSFNTVVAIAVGHDGSEYKAKIVGYEQREENIDSSKTATLFKIEVHKDDQTWFVYRRHAQFNKLALKLKEKKLLSSIGLKATLPPKKADAKQSMQALNNYLTTLLSRTEVATSHYIGNFLQPVQLGDSKPQNC